MIGRRVRYVVVDNCPVPKQLAPFLTELLHATGATLNSCYRGADAEGLLHRLGKHSQRELYNAWRHREPGANPANPPGRSTHELRNDGTAYAGAPGAELRWWQVGIDIDDGHVPAFIAAAGKRGWKLTRTYPASRSEYHHLNFRRPPLRARVLAHVTAARMQHLSVRGAAFIGHFEGFRPAPYNDAAGYATIGFGHLIGLRPVTPSDRRRWQTITRKQALRLLQVDAEAAASAVRTHVKVRLSQAEFDALVSFVFNTGAGAFATSTLLAKLNAGDRGSAAAEFAKWTHAGDKTLPGLATRRAAETRLFQHAAYIA